MGKVRTEMRLVNSLDLFRVKDRRLDPSGVRALDLTEVLVDTGATTLCLPADLVDQLGLEDAEEVPVETASGDLTVRRFSGVRIEILGRSTVVDCLELPVGRPPLLGVVPLELMGLQPDIRRHVLVPLPMEPGRSYLTI
ncbi:hypothetical protein AYO38_11600 [bacterium SCGC AG-212-C10]|nr:hypothetical protein AYO38_11600 [bacterium SCGC AG-212-C10]